MARRRAGPVLIFGPDVYLGFDSNSPVAHSYEGLAPDLVGVDQINVQIPAGSVEGCAVPVLLDNYAALSPTTTISIHTGRGQCVDPPAQSYGQVALTKTITYGAGDSVASETFTASFPSAPGLPAPPPPQILPFGSYQGVGDLILPTQTCAVPGYNLLSAGSINVTAESSGQMVQASPASALGGVSYQQALPAGFITPGQYSFAASGNTLGFQGTLAVGSPIQIQTALPPGTVIDPADDKTFTVSWTGGDPGTLVKVSLLSLEPASPSDVWGDADASAGSITFPPACIVVSGQPDCRYGVASSNNEEVVVEVSPYPANITTFESPGLTGPIPATWT